MRCSKCSENVKPVVAIDIDGTLGDYHGHFMKFAESYFGRPLPRTFDGSVEFHEALGLPLSEYREAKLAYRQGGGKRTMPRFDGAGIMVRRLRQVAEVFITTTRPYLRLDQTDPDTREWLRRAEIEYDGLLYHEDKYEVLSEIVDPRRVVAVLDDLPEQYDSAKRMFGERVPILRRNNFNTATSRPNQVSDLAEALAEINERIHEWEVKNA
jgi:uncharacterized HAD superfamily protein